MIFFKYCIYLRDPISLEEKTLLRTKVISKIEGVVSSSSQNHYLKLVTRIREQYMRSGQRFDLRPLQI